MTQTELIQQLCEAYCSNVDKVDCSPISTHITIKMNLNNCHSVLKNKDKDMKSRFKSSYTVASHC